MSHHATVSQVDQLIETVHQHLSENSWMNILDLDNWVIGLTQDEDAACDWHKSNGPSTCRYWKSFDCGSAENAKQVLSYFQSIGLNTGNNYPSSGDAKLVYAFKTSV